MRSVLAATVACAAFAAATSALATAPPELISNALASTSGGCNGCGNRVDQTLQPANSGQLLTSNVHDSNGFSSFGNAQVTTGFGVQHVYADAFQSLVDPGPDVQSQAYSEYDEHFAPGAINGTTISFAINGTASLEPTFGPGWDATLLWQVMDDTTNFGVASGTFTVESGGAPSAVSFFVPLTDASSLRVSFEVSAFSQNPYTTGTTFGDFSHTVHTYLDNADGSPVIGLSGHDYSTPAAAGGVPEPGAWALMLLGFGGLGAALRRRRIIVAA